MVVQHNLTAMNANRQLGITTGAQAKSSEKLSSGYRINRAGDDAAGLKISEKMRSQIRGLDKASANAQDGVSLIQTAEGALSETHSILQRMNELAVQGANDTNETVDRDAINQELDALTKEIDRISTTTQFNKQNLLDGSFSSKNFQVGANANQKISLTIDNMNAKTLGLRSIAGDEIGKVQTGDKPVTIQYKKYSYSYNTENIQSQNQKEAVSVFKAAISADASPDQYTGSIATNGSLVYYGTKSTGEVSTGKAYTTAASAMKADVSLAKKMASNAIMGTSFGKYVIKEKESANDVTVLAKGGAFTLSKPGVDTYARANATITAVQNAISKVSSQRSSLGALQNRLEHTIANLDNISENTSSAESRIRDTDMADEMVNYSKNNILAQAGQSMLAQANQINQGVLSLLQ